MRVNGPRDAPPVGPAELAQLAFFEGLDAGALEEICAGMRIRRFAAREFLCREGEPSDSLFVIQNGLAQVVLEGDRRRQPLGWFGRGDVVGEMALVTGDARSASVLASVPTLALELRREAFGPLLARQPAVLTNLSRILSSRLSRANARLVARPRGEAVALLVGERGAALVPGVLEAARAASARGVQAVTLGTESLESFLPALDEARATHGSVVAVAALDHPDLLVLHEHLDRSVGLATTAEAEQLRVVLGELAERVEVVRLSDDASGAPGGHGLPTLRAVDPARPVDVAWLGRHLTRTKIGLALGAGGAAGYAHVGVLQVLEEAGYPVDCVAGTSVGAMIGAWLAMGLRAGDIEAVMRRVHSPENVARMFKLSWAGLSTGVDLHRRMCRETTRDRSFAELALPLVVMALDLDAREAVAIREGQVWEALVASTSLAGLFPPVELGGRRLVDAVAVAPVPTASVEQAGADITISVSLMSREALAAWPTETPAPSVPVRRGVSALDALLEVMDVAQLDASVRQAAQADVVITPSFGPSTWRDFHLADLFMAAGRDAARAQLPALRARARPQSK